MNLVHLPNTTTKEEVVQLLKEEGYCIIDNAVPVEVIDSVNEEMSPYLDDTDLGGNNALGRKTRRAGALPARSLTSHKMIMHPIVLGAAEDLLCENSTVMQLNLTQLICIDPGEKAQFLHRDEGAWDFFDHFPMDINIEVSTIWAMDDFTDENGATRVIPRSHKHNELPHLFSQSDTFPAEMSKGSVLVYTGKTIHGGGANRSQRSRRALNIDYCVGWVRQEENQYLSIPLEVARTLPEEMRKLIGYQLGGASLGYVREFEDPAVALFPETKGDPKIFMKYLERTAKFSKIAKGIYDFTGGK
ncbi:phytanoyl-CoA dioxygenase family protein [Burkholderia sp. Ac-20344]|uniref:phytanoyl-CoA dioxygenase family protein n=1 Tax=Burkholderia sp. Ac-20344 TaxID=2703890 RepID=UPI00197BDFD3|nr:phytanoyl-CoA dioxygenase family protein [Burkholderia sp. Ac-20344]MBN3836729.1 phytanoyl-CoA dioxygenase family protein [Burkholderia sp. Ac-20344]